MWLAPNGCMAICCVAICFGAICFGRATVAVAQMPYGPQQAGLGGSCPDCGTSYEQSTQQSFYMQFVGRRTASYDEPRGHPLKGHPLKGWIDEWLSPPGRHRGLGHPLQRESWLFRPFGGGWFMGMAQGGPAIADHAGAGNRFSGGVNMEQGFIGGYRLGWDSSYYWGAELRMSFASIELFDTSAAITAQQAADAEFGFEDDNPWLVRFDQRRDAAVQQWDVNLVYYPWGDSQWRPYLTVGLGANRIRLYDRLDHYYDSYLVAIPLAVGLKYRYNDRLALRFDVADNMAFSGGSAFMTQHNLAATLGVEVRFGGTRKAYWPWNPGRHYW